MSRLVAKLLLTVIIASLSCSSVSALAERRVDRRVGVVALAQLVGAAVDDAVKLVADDEWLIERDRARLGLPEELDHDRHLHRAGGVERLVGIDEDFRLAIERPEGDGDLGAARGNHRPQRRLERTLRRGEHRGQQEHSGEREAANEDRCQHG